MEMMADIVVLAENAAQVTAGKEYCARPAEADKYAFLAEMGADGANDRHITNTTKSYLLFAAVDFALTRTEHAGIHIIPQLLNGFAERTDISWQRRHNFVLRSAYCVYYVRSKHNIQQVYAGSL